MSGSLTAIGRGRTGACWRRLEAEFLSAHRWLILLSLAGMTLQSILILPVPLIHGWVLDQIIPLVEGSGQALQAEAGRLAWLIGIALSACMVCHLSRAVLAWKVAAVMTRVSLEVVRGLTDALHRKLQRLPMAYFDREQTGRVMARVTSDVGSLLIFLNSSSLQLVSDLIVAVVIAAALLWLEWRLALIAFAVIPIYVLNHRLLGRKLREMSRGVQAQVAAIYALLSERVSAVRLVRSFAQEKAEIEEFDDRIDTHRALCWSSARTGALQGAIAALAGGVGTVAVVSFGVWLVTASRFSVGELLSFYALLALLYNPILRLTQFQGILAGTLVAVERMMEILEETETVCDQPGARRIYRPRGEVTFRDVSFTYRPGRPLALERVSLQIKPGMTVGITGPSGGGKSTLLALAPRLYDVPDGHGTVLFDGSDVRGLRLADLRRTVALVPQQALLFEGTIRSNLVYAAPEASAAVIRRAVEAVDLADLIAGLPQGLETRVGERGVTLSGGQRQRLALARALIAEPTVLLLDDCTSALDAETEARIQVALATLLAGRTCVIVSHKVLSVRRADHIIVLQAGRIVEEGDHDKLIALNGVYAKLSELQTQCAIA